MANRHALPIGQRPRYPHRCRPDPGRSRRGNHANGTPRVRLLDSSIYRVWLSERSAIPPKWSCHGRSIPSLGYFTTAIRYYSRANPYSSDHSVVIGVRPDPEPDQIIAVANAESAPVQADSDRIDLLAVCRQACIGPTDEFGKNSLQMGIQDPSPPQYGGVRGRESKDHGMLPHSALAQPRRNRLHSHADNRRQEDGPGWLPPDSISHKH